MADDFTNQAVQLAVQDLEENLIYASREYEDAQRRGDTQSAAFALKTYTDAQVAYEKLTGAGQQSQQQADQLTTGEQDFIRHQRSLGNDLRMEEFVRGAMRAQAAGLQRGSAQYCSAISGHINSLGDGRQPVLDEREAARLCGVDEQTYADGANRLRQMKARGFYQT